jgi:hypothetical protein
MHLSSLTLLESDVTRGIFGAKLNAAHFTEKFFEKSDLGQIFNKFLPKSIFFFIYSGENLFGKILIPYYRGKFSSELC